MLSALFCAVILAAQTAHVMPGKWYDEIMYATDNTSRIPANVATKFNVTFDDQALTIRVDMKDPNAKDLLLLPRGQDGKWPICESIEIFLDPGRTCSNYQQIAIFADHSRWDRRWPKKIKTTWTSSFKIRDDGWYVELRLPYKDYGMVKPKVGDVWGFNFCRNVKNPKTGNYFATWAHVGSVFNRPERFGMLVFGSPEEAAKARTQKLQKELTLLTAELERKGVIKEFASQLRKMKEKCTETDIRDIREELLIIEKMKGL